MAARRGDQSQCASAFGSRGHGFGDEIDRLTGTLRSYISAGLVSRLYADASQTRSRETPPDTSVAPRSEHEQVLAELHLTSNLTAHDLNLIRRKFAMANHPARVAPPARNQATRRMTIANMLIDDALRGMNARTRSVCRDWRYVAWATELSMLACAPIRDTLVRIIPYRPIGRSSRRARLVPDAE